MKNILILILIHSLSIGLFACPDGTNTEINGQPDGTYSFTYDIDYSGTSYGLYSVIWDFGDGTTETTYPTGSPTSITNSHQYDDPFTQFTVSVTLTGLDASANECVNTLDDVVFNTEGIILPTCPAALFLPVSTSNSCDAGELEFAWDFCNEDYDYDGVGDNYWTADHVEWNTSDGQSYTSNGLDNIIISFGSSSTVTVTGIAYFTGVNGESCSTPIQYSSAANDNPCALGDSVIPGTPFTVSGTSYIEVDPPYAEPNIYVSSGSYCADDNISVNDAGGVYNQSTSNWSYELFIDGQSVESGSGLPSGALFQNTLPPGDHLIELVYINGTGEDSCSVADAIVVNVDDCGGPGGGSGGGSEECEICNGFTPEIGKRYWISAWVKEDYSSQVKKYEDAHITIDFIGNNGLFTFYPTGDIIEGWQRIVGSFTIPNATTDIKINLNSADAQDAYFDDIRIHPFNASAKSYVYDPETLLLTAELDDNNYATFYEYDKEGKLIRIKKETSRGVVTIQESRSSNVKED
ncbi:MAG: hypothetical protein WED10_15480 [Brumimicrobium sp.]